MDAKPPHLQQGQSGGQTQTPQLSPPIRDNSMGTPTGLLPALSPELTRPGSSQPGQAQAHPQYQQQHQQMMRQQLQAARPAGAAPPSHSRTHTPQHSQHNVFQAVMGARPGQVPQEDVGGAGNVKVYASAYSQIPVFEAMIRNISVMRRMADSWVNATQILKVAGISKSVRTKILEKQVQTQQHEKVQGGYGKYQGTWIPLDKGRALAEQYGVLSILAPIFDFVPPPTGPPALPMRGGSATPNAKTPGTGSGMVPGSGSGNRMMSPFAHSTAVPPPPQFAQHPSEMMMGHGGQQPQMLYPPQGMQGQPMFYGGPQHPMHQHQHPHHQLHPHHQQLMYEQQQQQLQHAALEQQQQHLQHAAHQHAQQQHQQQQQTRLEPSAPIDVAPALQPAATINGHGSQHMHGLPPPNDMYVDAYGQPRPVAGSSAGPPFVDGAPPAKRQRTDEEAPVEETNASTEDDDEDIGDRPPLPASFRLSTKPFKPRLSAQSYRRRQQLLSLFQADEVDVRAVFELTPGETPDWDIDMVIDEQGHTGLHWACALAKMNVIAQLIQLGADIHRGNYAGETPLIRSVLTTNHAEAGTFSTLLSEHLGASVRTLDHAYCSVIHHIAFSSGLKGRSACARGYMAAVLEYVAKEQSKEAKLATNGSPVPDGTSLKRLVDLQDVRGDTALNAAARMGSKPLVNLLLDAGADKTKANKLGLRPVDFGVEVDALAVSAREAAVGSLKSEIKRPEKRSQDVLKNISGLFEDMNKTFDAEMEKHVEALGGVEKSVRVATRSLAERRQQVEAARQRLATLEQQAERATNAQRALSAPDADWTGRTMLKGESALPPAFGMLPPTAGGAPAPENVDGALDLPAEGDIVALRRLAAWEDRAANLLEERTKELEGDGADKAVMYRKVIALCAKVGVEQVDDMLDGLTTAVESDGRAIDLTRIAGVVNRLRKVPA